MPGQDRGDGGLRDALALGRDALARGAWEEARDLFELASSGPGAAEALEGLGWALWWLDRVEESLAAREKAFALHSRGGDRRRAARVALALAVDTADVRGPALTRGWLERARTLLGPLPETPEHGWLELWRGHVHLLFDDDPEAARRSAERTGALARRFGLSDLELLGRALEGLVLVREGDVAGGMRRLDEATAAAVSGEIADLDAVATACCFMVYACEHVRDYDRASQWHGRVDALSRAWGIRDPLAGCRVQHAKLLLWTGRWPEAEALLASASETGTATRPANARESAACLGELRRRQGRAAEAEKLFLEAEGLSSGFLGLASLALDRGDAHGALEHLDRAARRVGPGDLAMRIAILEQLLTARLATRETAAAREAGDELDDLAAKAGTPALLAAARLSRGRLALAGRAFDDAVRATEDAVDLFVASGAAWETARARLLLSEARSARGARRAGRERGLAGARSPRGPRRRGSSRAARPGVRPGVPPDGPRAGGASPRRRRPLGSRDRPAARAVGAHGSPARRQPARPARLLVAGRGRAARRARWADLRPCRARATTVVADQPCAARSAHGREARGRGRVPVPARTRMARTGHDGFLRGWPLRAKRRGAPLPILSAVPDRKEKEMGTKTKLILGAALAALAAGPSLAQDWMTVAPKGKKVLLDNASVRVVEMTLAPGQKEPVHTHPANFAYLMTSGKVRVSYVGGETVVLDGKAGEALWSDPEGPHTLESLAKKPLRALVVELKEHPYVAAAKK